jgi:hypothetical protein
LQNISYGLATFSDGGLTSPNDNSNAAVRTIQFTNPQTLSSNSPSLQYYYALPDGVSPGVIAEKMGLILENPVHGAIDPTNYIAAVIINEVPQSIATIESDKLNLKIYPNPFSDVIKLANNNNLRFTSIELLNTIGDVVLSFDVSSTEMNLSNLPKGMYSLKFTTNDNVLFKKVVKQ